MKQAFCLLRIHAGGRGRLRHRHRLTHSLSKLRKADVKLSEIKAACMYSSQLDQLQLLGEFYTYGLSSVCAGRCEKKQIKVTQSNGNTFL